jgi:hypothetical protein
MLFAEILCKTLLRVLCVGKYTQHIEDIPVNYHHLIVIFWVPDKYL